MSGSTMCPGDCLCDGQTQTCSSAGASRVCAAEPLEGSREKVCSKAQALIGHMQLDGLAVPAREYAHVARTVSYRIVDQVAQRLFEPEPITDQSWHDNAVVGRSGSVTQGHPSSADQRRYGRAADPHGASPGGELDLVVGRSPSQQVVDRQGFQPYRLSALVRCGHQKQILG
jgi:hypothetical protein